MLDGILQFVMRRRLLVVLGAVLLMGAGAAAWLRLPVDAFPDVTNVQVMILTPAPGLTPSEVERLVSYPIEIEMSGLPDVVQIRSLSKSSLSQVVVVFEDHVDTYFARQLVFERLVQARGRIPDGLEPEMGPISTGLGEIYQYVVESGHYCPEHESVWSREPAACPECGVTLRASGRDLMDLRTLQDWHIAPQLRRLPGINEVNSFGGFVKQYHVTPDPDLLLKYGIALAEVLDAIEANNANAGGGFIVRDGEQINVVARGLLQGIPDIEGIVLKTGDGTPVYLRDLAKVSIGRETRYGIVTQDGRDETVIGMAIMLKGSNSKIVVDRVRKAIPGIQKSLPPGVRIRAFYDRTSLIQQCLRTVSSALVQGGILIVIILFLLLWDLRAALTVALALPLTAAGTFLLMSAWGLTANLMSLGGLVIAMGIVVDGAIIVAENISRHMRDQADSDISRAAVALGALREVARPSVFAIAIIIVVFLPLFTLGSLEGKMFRPLALTMCFALASSILVSLTIVPVLASLVVRRSAGTLGGDAFLRLLHGIHMPVLSAAMKHGWLTLALSGAAVVGALLLLPRLGTEFMPALDEGAIAVNVVRLPTASVGGSARQCLEIERRLLERFPEIDTVVSKTGRASIAEDPMGPEQSDVFIMLKPRGEWTRSKTQLVRQVSDEMRAIPGIQPAFSQPIALRVNELISGIKADVAIKVFGDDTTVLQETAGAIAPALHGIAGARDISVEQVSGFSEIRVRMDRETMARHRVNAADINNIIEAAVGGKIATTLYEGQKQFDVQVRFAPERRSSIADLKRILVPAPGGYSVPLGDLADIDEADVPAQISREDAGRRILVQCNIRGRDLGTFIAEAQSALAGIEKGLPNGYRIEWGGQFENQQRAMRRLQLVVPVALLLIFLMLYSSLSSVKSALLVLLNLPFAVVGGVLTLYVFGIHLSVPATIGFITLLGMAVEDGLVLVSFFDQLRAEGMPLREAIFQGCWLRIRPVVMTTLTTLLGLLPMLYATGSGSEIQKPLVAVVFGGMVTALALTLVVLPVLYALCNRERRNEE